MMQTTSFPRTGLLFLVAFVMLAAAAMPAAAQIPEKFTNLQLLPKDVARQDLIDQMRGFATALGVRCNHCHVGDKPDLQDYDFAADTKEEKEIARVMMKMTREINEKLIPEINHEPHLQVGCITCHRGLERPQTLADVMVTAAETQGAEGAIRRYRALKEQYYGTGSYDFSAVTLHGVAERLARQKKLDDAIAIMLFNNEVNLNRTNSYSLLGDLYARKGDKAAALAAYQKAVDLDPKNDFARKKILELKQ